MRYTGVLAGGSIAAVVVAVVNPPAAHLALRWLFVLTVITVGVHLIVGALRRLPESPFRAEPHEYELDPAELPRDLFALAEELRTSRRLVPHTVRIRLARQFAATLRIRHGLSVDDPDDRPAVDAMLSPAARTVLSSYGGVRLHHHDLDALLHELEQL